MLKVFTMRTFLLTFLLFPLSSIGTSMNEKADLIIGTWKTAERNSLVVEVYKSDNEYKAKIVWFNDSDDKSIPMTVRCDTKNPDKRLRTRKLIGLEVMSGLKYNDFEKEWQSGKIYDATNGKTWDVKARLNNKGLLNVRGYWHLSILGQTMNFKKI